MGDYSTGHNFWKKSKKEMIVDRRRNPSYWAWKDRQKKSK